MIKEKRNTNIEILRIISMLMIIVSHYTVHNGVTPSTLPLGINRYLLEILELGNIGVIIFVMITGFFNVTRIEKINVKKIIKIYFQVVFYSLGIYIVFILLGIEKISIITLLKSCLPIIFKQYWFVTTYVILLLIMPYLNILIDKLSKEEYLKLLLLSILIVSVIPFLTTQDFASTEITQFILFYMLGGYLKKYPPNVSKKCYYYLLIFTILMLLGSVLIFDVIGLKYNVFAKYSTYLFSRKSPVAILFSIGIMGIFLNKNEFSNSLINKISSSTFGVYLLHDNNLIRKVLWTKVLRVPNYVDVSYLWLHILGSVIIVFSISVFIEWLRINTIERFTNKMLSKCISKINGKIEKTRVELTK